MDTDMPRAADALRELALNESVKSYILEHPVIDGIARRVSERYVAGFTREEALETCRVLASIGHRTTVDFMGESARSRDVAVAATDEFVRLVEDLAAHGLRASGLSLDLSHIGSLIDHSFGRGNLRRIAEAAGEAGQEVMISMEGHDRTDQILGDHSWLAHLDGGGQFDHVGITLQARLNRTATDLEVLLEHPGRIRLVKGAYPFPAEIALLQDDAFLAERFDSLAHRLLETGHRCAIATHDSQRLDAAAAVISAASCESPDYVFEFLHGIAPELRDTLSGRGHPTQEYLVYGDEYFLYTCNRLAEDPSRLYQALTDAMAAS